MHANGFSYIIGRDDTAAPVHRDLARILPSAQQVIPQLISRRASLADRVENLGQAARR